MPEFRSAWLESGAGKIHLALWGDKGPVILFLPGTGCAAQFYEPFLLPLSKEGFRVVGIDYRGHGQSDGARGRFTIPGLLEDVSNAATWLIDNMGGSPGVMGSSMGGILTIFAAASDNRFACALAHNAAIPSELSKKLLEGRIGAPILGALARVAPHLKVHTRAYVKWGKVMEDREFLKTIMKDPLFVTHYEASAIHSLLTYSPNLENIRCPVMVLTGANDEVVPEWSSKDTFDKINAPKEFVSLPNAKHMLLIEYMERTMPIVVGWFRRRLTKN